MSESLTPKKTPDPVSAPMQYRRLRAPLDHGGRLIDPPLTDVQEVLNANRTLFDAHECDLQGCSLQELSRDAQADLISSAIQFTSRYQEVDDGLADSSRPIVMTGHQPQLYHPGVWAKNFVLDRVARDEQAIAINLLIDNDAAHSSAIRVPTGSVTEPAIQSIAFDRASDEVPFEQRELRDRDTFRSFSERVCASLLPAISEPLVRQLWPAAVAAAKSNSNLGQCISQARHQLETAWGLKSLEVPLSHMCNSKSFRWFAAVILTRLPDFREIYNDSLMSYRKINRLRSLTHPVPALASDDEWLEAPFWLWSKTDPSRRRVFMRQTADGIEISDRHSERHLLSLNRDRSCEVGVEQIGHLARQGVKLRPRALLTTMFARLCLCDLFIHGIGGAKYDQLTDAIIARFFGIAAPKFLTATATAKLPLEFERVTSSEVTAIDLELRELRFNPQRFLASTKEVASLVEEKQRLIESVTEHAQRRERYFQIAQLNAAMQPFVEKHREQLGDKRSSTVEQVRINKLLGSREFSFCLFPESTLRALLLDI